MRISVVSRHVADPEGTAAGRLLSAWVSGMVAAGHEIDVTSWVPGDVARGWVATKARALVAPRGDAALLGWAPAPGAVPLADDPVSFPAVGRFPGAAVTFHYATSLDSRRAAHHRFELRDVQDLRADRRAAHRAARVLAYSERVATALPGRASVVPAAIHVPPAPLPLVDHPVAGLIGQWDWPPNKAALQALLAAWPEVRSRVPGARLVLSGRGFDAERSVDGIEPIGEVGRVAEFLSQIALLAFPCPDTSGPKVKVLDAMAHGVAVLTTEAGIEGIGGDVGSAVVPEHQSYVDRLVALLNAPHERARLAAAGRAAVMTHHTPAIAAAARAAALNR